MTDVKNHPVFKSISHWYAADQADNSFTGEMGSRFDIISHAVSAPIGQNHIDHRFHILEGTKSGVRLSSQFIAVDFIDEVNAGLDWGDGDEPIRGVTDTQAAELESRVRAVIDQWQMKNRLRFEVWEFDGVSNEEEVVLVDGFDRTDAEDHCFRRCADRGEPPCYDLPNHSSDAWNQTITPCAECLADAEAEQKASAQ